MTKQTTIDLCKKQVSEIVGSHGLSCLINNAAQSDRSQDVIENLTVDGLRHLYEVNAIGPAMVIKVLMDYILFILMDYILFILFGLPPTSIEK